MPCTPLRVCAPPSGFPIRASTFIDVKCNWAGSITTHTPWSAQGCRALPCECAHHPLASQSGPTLSLLLNVTVQAHHTHPMVSPRMPCTPLRVCAPSSGFPIRANTIIHIKCNCAGSPQTNLHTPHSQPTDNMHCPTACTPPPASPSRPAPPSTSCTTTEFLNDLKTFWSTPLPVASL